MIRFFRRMVGFSLAVMAAAVLTGCSLPSYNVSDDGSPAEALRVFLDTFIREDYRQAGELTENCDFGDSLISAELSGEKAVSLKLAEVIGKSRSYQLTDNVRETDSHQAYVEILYTTFNLEAFEKDVTGKVENEVQERRYAGEEITDPEDTKDLITDIKLECLRTPETYYLTKRFEVRLVSRKGRWLVVISDDFYKALTSYAV